MLLCRILTAAAPPVKKEQNGKGAGIHRFFGQKSGQSAFFAKKELFLFLFLAYGRKNS